MEDCKSNSPNNPKTAIEISPNISYWEMIIEELLEMLLVFNGWNARNLLLIFTVYANSKFITLLIKESVIFT